MYKFNVLARFVALGSIVSTMEFGTAHALDFKKLGDQKQFKSLIEQLLKDQNPDGTVQNRLSFCKENPEHPLCPSIGSAEQRPDVCSINGSLSQCSLRSGVPG